MRRFALAAVLLAAVSGTTSAQCCPAEAVVDSAAPAGPGLLSRLNRPFLPGLPAVPGLPTVSPLGLLAPRLSFLSTFVTAGGFGNLSGNLPTLVGFALPRVAPIVGVARNWPPTPQTLFNAGLGVVSPRLATGVQLVQGYQQTGRSVGGLLGRRCR